jgi:hypothetical protein
MDMEGKYGSDEAKLADRADAESSDDDDDDNFQFKVSSILVCIHSNSLTYTLAVHASRSVQPSLLLNAHSMPLQEAKWK